MAKQKIKKYIIFLTVFIFGFSFCSFAKASVLKIEESWTSSGDNKIDAFYGNSVSFAGDVNGDGYADVIVGAYGYNSNVGRVYVYLGSKDGLSSTPAWISSGDNKSEAYYGYSVSSAGDVNGDGYADVIVGAPFYNSNVGRAYLYLGSKDGLSSTPAWTSSGDNQPTALYGNSVSSAGDVNGDGYADVIVGAVGYNFHAGRVYVYLGSKDGLSSTPAWTSSGEDQSAASYGYSVSSAGDVNGDGYAEVIVGAPRYDTQNSDAGKVYLYFGSKNGLSSTPAWTSSGEDQSSASYGYSVSSAGDVNGDGYADVIVGAYGYNSYAGKSYLYLGSKNGLSSTSAWTSSGEDQSRAYYGYSVFSAGDVNGDGYTDVIVGAPFYDTQNSEAGKVYLYLGSKDGLSSTPAWTSSGDNQPTALYGYSVSSAGDANGDGYAELIVGAVDYNASIHNTSIQNAGKAYLYTNKAIFSISINSNAQYTNSQNVNLTFSTNTNPTQMIISENSNFQGALWEPYFSFKSFSLSLGDGPKTVYARFKDESNIESKTINSRIILDTTAPSTKASPVGKKYKSIQKVALISEDNTGGAGVSKIYYTTDGSEPTTSSSVYKNPITITRDTTLKFFAEDKVGNKEKIKTANYIIQKAKFVTKKAKKNEVAIQKKNKKYYANDFDFLFKSLPKELLKTKYYLEIQRKSEYPKFYPKAKQHTLKKIWVVKTNLNKYKSRSNFRVKLVFKYTAKELNVLKKQNKTVKEKDLVLKYWNPNLHKWEILPARLNTKNNTLTITFFGFYFPIVYFTIATK